MHRSKYTAWWIFIHVYTQVITSKTKIKPFPLFKEFPSCSFSVSTPFLEINTTLNSITLCQFFNLYKWNSFHSSCFSAVYKFLWIYHNLFIHFSGFRLVHFGINIDKASITFSFYTYLLVYLCIHFLGYMPRNKIDG